ncbi:MAG: hypothetical protein LBB94_07875 [Clostridiales bacterium]|nr:hypothetical protein [Clostridiales bacterium]
MIRIHEIQTGGLKDETNHPSSNGIFLALALCACNGGGNSGTTPTSRNPAQATIGESTQAQTTTPEIPQALGASAAVGTQPPTENNSGQENPENVRITFITQEYNEDGDIVEIPYFEYDGTKNDVIDGINRLFNQGLQMRYEEFNANPGSSEWIEIKTYPFTDERYVQVVITSNVFGVNLDYQWSGTVESVNYDKLNNKWILFSDLGIDEGDILAKVRKLYMQNKDKKNASGAPSSDTTSALSVSKATGTAGGRAAGQRKGRAATGSRSRGSPLGSGG